MALTTGTALALAGTAISAFGQIQQGRNAQKQANFQAQVDRQRAERERQIAQVQSEEFARKQERLMATRRALEGGTGRASGTGTSLLLSEDFAKEAKFNELLIRSGGETRATRLEQQAGLTQFAGRNARRAGFAKAGGTLFSGIGRTASLLKDKPKVG